MTAGLKPYPAYRDSGLPWLGEIPEGWKLVVLFEVGAAYGGPVKF